MSATGWKVPRIPPAQVARGAARVTVGLLFAGVLWIGLGLSGPVDRALIAATRAVAGVVVPRVRVIPKGLPNAPQVAEMKVRVCLGPRLETNVFMPLLIFLLLPAASVRETAEKIAIATGLIAVGDVLLAVGLQYGAFRTKLAVIAGTAPASAPTSYEGTKAVVALGACFYVFPVLAALGGHFGSRWGRRLLAKLRERRERTPPPKAKPAPDERVGRNAPCPCGSGKKFKRCCG